MSADLCSVADDSGSCPRTTRARGMCQSHWQRWKRTGDPGPVQFKTPVRDKHCSIDGCTALHAALGLCATHYSAQRRTGDPLSAKGVGINRPSRRYTEQEMATISDRSIPAREAALELGLTEMSVAHIRREMDFGDLRLSDWLDSEIDLIIDSMGKMHTAKIAAFLNRDEKVVKTEIQRLRSNGFVDKRSNQSLNPRHVGKRTLLAMTCPACGELRTAEWFGRNKGGTTYKTECRRCASKRTRRNEETQGTKRDLHSEYIAKVQAITVERATNHGKEWVDADQKTLADPSKTVLEKALELKRTYNATASAVSRFGHSSRPDFKRMDTETWRIFWEFEDLTVAS